MKWMWSLWQALPKELHKNLFYSIKHQNENVFIDITPTSLMNSQPLSDTIYISLRDGEKNICIRAIGEPYKFYLHRNKETNELESWC